MNLPSADIVDAINNIANTTGTKNVPLHKKTWGYRYLKNKIEEAGLTVQQYVNPDLSVEKYRVKEMTGLKGKFITNLFGFLYRKYRSSGGL
ncbi:MAG: hypothetical protein JKY24_02980 [Pseudomonadales bacterium]|nr:hypothetical protein [Pseudomonadales bacterium]